MHFLPFCTGVLSDSLGQDQGSDAALHRPTPPHPSLHRGKCSPSYGNAAACGPWMWRRWAPGGPQTTCSASFTPATGMSTVSFSTFIHGGREKDAQGGGGVPCHPGGVAGRVYSPTRPLARPCPADQSSEKLPLFYLAVFPHLVTPRYLPQPILYSFLLAFPALA